jgi:hypothetical protein
MASRKPISVEAALAAAARGEPPPAEIVRVLKPQGVMGSLAEMPLTEVLQNMDFAKKSGRVDIWIDDAEGSVHVADGSIVRAIASTSAGATEGESAILDLCRLPGGFFAIRYGKEDVEQNVHRPTTFVLLEALRVIDEMAAPRSVPAAIDLGFELADDPPQPKTRTDVDFPAFLADDDDKPMSAWNDPSTILEIEVDAGAAQEEPLPKGGLVDLIAESEFLVAAGDLERARKVLSRAQGLAPADDDVRVKLLKVNEAIDAAQAYSFLDAAMKGGPQAVELARRATQLRPARDVLLRSLAVFARGGAHDEVADVAEQLLELDPEDEGALRTLLDANVAMKRYSVAMRAVEALLKKKPNDEQLKQIAAKLKSL